MDPRNGQDLHLLRPDDALFAESGRPSQAARRGGRFAGGVVECGTNRPSWLPYVEVAHFDEVTERAHRFGAGVLLEPRVARPAGAASSAVPEGREIASWWSKTPPPQLPTSDLDELPTNRRLL